MGYFSFSAFSPSSSASSSASSSPSGAQNTSYQTTSPYSTSTISTSPMSIASPCAYPSWPSRPSLNSCTTTASPYALTTASSYLSDEDLFPLEDEQFFNEPSPMASPNVAARQVLDTAAIRELLLEESARKEQRKARKAAKSGSSSKSRRRSSANSEKKSGKLSPIAEGSYQE